MKNMGKMLPKGSPSEGQFAKDKTMAPGAANGSNRSSDQSKSEHSKNPGKRVPRKK